MTRKILACWAAVVGISPNLADEPIAAKIAAVIDGPAYRHARWGVLVADSKSGEIVYERDADKLFIPASTTKIYSCAAALAAFGPGHRFETKVVRHGGDLVLIASGDLTLGGRTRPDGTMAYTDSDHTYADSTSTGTRLTDTDPLAGLNELARQVKQSVDDRMADVGVYDRLFDRSTSSGSGPRQVAPIYINDNVIDFIIEQTDDGPPKVTIRPETAFIEWKSEIEMAGDGEETDVYATTVGHRKYVVRGKVSKKDKYLVRIAEMVDPAAFARCLFIEALKRAGVDIANDGRMLSHKRYDADKLGQAGVVAKYQSPPLSELTKVTLKVSHNLYASTLPSLVASKHGGWTARDGLRWQGQFLRELGVGRDEATFAGGAGGLPADMTSPRATVGLLRALAKRPEYAALIDGLPILGEDGTLASVVPKSSPARGKVRAKTGTLGYTDFLNNRVMLRSKALAGVMTTATGRELTFAMFVNDVPLPPGVTSQREGKVLGRLCEILYEGVK